MKAQQLFYFKTCNTCTPYWLCNLVHPGVVELRLLSTNICYFFENGNTSQIHNYTQQLVGTVAECLQEILKP